jgi:hypothetical protein
MKAVRWEDTKREIQELEPGWDAPDRVAELERSRAEMRAEQRGYQLARLRKNAGLTQAQVAAVMGCHASAGLANRAWQDHRSGRYPRVR